MGSQSSIALPMSGPSKRTLIVAAVGIASLGVALGAVIGWRALAGPRTAPAATTPETNVGLVERPTLIPHADGGGGVGADAAVSTVAPPASRAARTAFARGRPVAPSAPPAAAAPVAAGTSRAGADHGSPGATQPGELAAPTPPTPPEPATRAGHSAAAVNAAHPTATPPGPMGPTAATPALAAIDPPAPDLAGPQGPSVGGYRPGDATDATGTIDPNAFQFVYRHYRPQISACHSEVTRGGQDVVGTMRVRVRLGTNGHVVRTRVISNTTNNEALATCVTNTVQTWHYPSPEGGEVEFDYNFGFGS